MPATYDKIATQTLGSATASVTFSGIPGTYTDLILVASLKQNTTTTITGATTRVNGDAATNYSNVNLYGNGTSAFSNRRTSVDAWFWLIDVPTTSLTDFIYQFNNYSNTTTFKTMLSRISNASGLVIAQGGLYRSTSAITSITMAGGDSGADLISTGSTFTLYGIKAA
jgi:hypothetical protein